MLKLGVAARKDISLPSLSALTERSSRPATPAAELEALGCQYPPYSKAL